MALANTQDTILAQKSIRAALGILVDEFNARNKTLTVIQVGACNGNIDNDPLHELIKGQPHTEAHLVEAVGWLFDGLVEVMAPYADYIHCHHAALGPRNETRPFFSVSQRYGFDQPKAPDWQKYQIGSLTDEYLKLHVPEEYISSDMVTVISPATFMDRAGVDAKNLNLLVTDTEGFDGEIVCAFLEISQPEVIVYEHNVMRPEESSHLYKLLEDRGYTCKTYGVDVLGCQIR
jgi:hypothetical protein